MKRFKAVVAYTNGFGGYYGYGDTQEEAMQAARKAAGSSKEWNACPRRVIVDCTTGEEVHREGKR